jgi:hypothetical protein
VRRRLCAAILTFEAVVLGLTTPVLISVEQVDPTRALWTGLGLTVLCVVTAGLLRRPWAYGLGWLIQVAAIVLGLQITAMIVLGVVFLALWVAAYLLGGRIDDHQAQVARLVAADDTVADEPVLAPEQWEYELVCESDTYRSFARAGAHDLLRPQLLALPGLCVLTGVLVLLLAPGNRLVGGLLVVLGATWPLVWWLAQRQAWRAFLAEGRVYRTTFADDRLLVQSDGRLFAVDLDQIAGLTTERGLVSARLADRGVQLQLPEPVFPPAEQERIRRRLPDRPPSADDPARP